MKVDRRKTGMIFSAVAIVGVGVTACLSAIRAPKFKELLEKEEETKKGAIKAALKTQYPAIISGGITIAAIIFAEGLNLKEISVLGGMVTYLVTQREKIFETIDGLNLSKEDREKFKEAARNAMDENKEADICYIVKPGPSVEETGRGDLLCFEKYSGRWFRSNEVDVDRAIFKTNEHFCEGLDTPYNYFFETLGLEPTGFGNQFGWSYSHYYYDGDIIFETKYVDRYESKNEVGQIEMLNEPVLVIECLTYPMEYWYSGN